MPLGNIFASDMVYNGGPVAIRTQQRHSGDQANVLPFSIEG